MYNKAILIGRLTADPELRQTPSGTSVTSFSIAVNRTFASRSGERQTDFFDIVCWQRQAEFVTRYFKKGNAIGIDGRMEMRDYTDKMGNKRRAFEIVAENVFFVESKSAAAGSAPGMPSNAPGGASFDVPSTVPVGNASAPAQPIPYSAPAPQQAASFSNGSFDQGPAKENGGSSFGEFEELDADDDLPF